MERDLAGVRFAQFLVYDADCRAPLGAQYHFIMAACALLKPVVVVSQVLETVPVYFAQYARAILKPNDLHHLGVILGHTTAESPSA
jgi:hypothetical protein